MAGSFPASLPGIYPGGIGGPIVDVNYEEAAKLAVEVGTKVGVDNSTDINSFDSILRVRAARVAPGNPAPQAGLGTTATATTVAGSKDGRGSITLASTGTGQAAGAQAIVTFANTFTNAPGAVILGFGSANCWTVQPYVSAITATTFTVSFGVGPTAAQTYTLYYWVVA